MQKDKINKDTDALAKRIADNLFVNGDGDRASRLVLELADGNDGGGLCEASVLTVIKDALNEKQ